MGKTDLEAVKRITKQLAKTRPVPAGNGSILSMIAVHPFVQDMIYLRKVYENKPANPNEYSFTKDEVFQEWLEEFYTLVDNCKDLHYLYYLWRDPYKLTFMKLCRNCLSDKDFAELLAESWTLEENPNMDVNVSREEALQMFCKASKRYLMTEEDYDYFCNLPETIEAYRGVSKGRIDLGLSWTDDKKKAEWFMQRFITDESEGKLLKAVISRDNVIAYFNTRGEKELLVDVFAIQDQIERII